MLARAPSSVDTVTTTATSDAFYQDAVHLYVAALESIARTRHTECRSSYSWDIGNYLPSYLLPIFYTLCCIDDEARLSYHTHTGEFILHTLLVLKRCGKI